VFALSLTAMGHIHMDVVQKSSVFLNRDYAEEDEKKHFKIILFIFFSVILVQKKELTFNK